MGLFDLLLRYRALPQNQKASYRRKFLDAVLHQRFSFSQFGEDASAIEWFRMAGVVSPTYLDIGGNHPVLHSNTFSMYRDGSSGTVVEANPVLAAKIRKKRPRDTVIGKAVMPSSGPPVELHIMNVDGLSTTSPEWASHLHNEQLVQSTRKVLVEVVGINDLLRSLGGPVDFASLDIEGIDYSVLEVWDFGIVRPTLLCVETGVVSNGKFSKDQRYAGLMASRGYHPLFETFANTIFVDSTKH